MKTQILALVLIALVASIGVTSACPGYCKTVEEKQMEQHIVLVEYVDFLDRVQITGKAFNHAVEQRLLKLETSLKKFEKMLVILELNGE